MKCHDKANLLGAERSNARNDWLSAATYHGVATAGRGLDQLFGAISALRIWFSGGVRAPHPGGLNRYAACRPFALRVMALRRAPLDPERGAGKCDFKPPPNAAITLRTVESSGFPSALRVL